MRDLFEHNPDHFPEDRFRKNLSKREVESRRMVRSYHFPRITEREFFKEYWTTPDYLPSREGPRGVAAPVQMVFLSRLEKRLDVAVFRCHFAESIYASHKIIKQGKVKVNGRIRTVSSYLLNPGDLISVDPQSTALLSGRASIDVDKDEWSLTQHLATIPEYLEVDYLTSSAVFIRNPLVHQDRVDIPTPMAQGIYEDAYNHYNKRYLRARATKSKKLDVDDKIYVSGELTGIKAEFKKVYDQILPDIQTPRSYSRHRSVKRVI